MGVARNRVYYPFSMSCSQCWAERTLRKDSELTALDVAVDLKMDYTGWCPLGGWAEDYPDPATVCDAKTEGGCAPRTKYATAEQHCALKKNQADKPPVQPSRQA